MAKRSESLPAAVFCDASYLVACFANHDQSHKKALRMAGLLSKRPIKAYTSWPTVSEAATLLLYHYGYSHAMALFQTLKTFEILVPFESECLEAITLFGVFNKDKEVSFNDLVSYALVRGRLKNIPILTFDSDFSKIGLTVFSPY